MEMYMEFMPLLTVRNLFMSAPFPISTHPFLNP